MWYNRRREIKWNVYWCLEATWNYYRIKWRLKEEVKCLKCWCVKYIDRQMLIQNRCWCRKCWHERHWMNKTRFYNIFRQMKARCTEECRRWYHNYGGRWIKVLWKSFEEFRDDMYESYLEHIKEYWEKETTIDIIDVDWNYCKENCRRATLKEQANNKQKKEWPTLLADELWISRNIVKNLYYRDWLTLEQIRNKFHCF
jgi:hypothetical protein